MRDHRKIENMETSRDDKKLHLFLFMQRCATVRMMSALGMTLGHSCFLVNDRDGGDSMCLSLLKLCLVGILMAKLVKSDPKHTNRRAKNTRNSTAVRGRGMERESKLYQQDSDFSPARVSA